LADQNVDDALAENIAKLSDISVEDRQMPAK